MNIVTIVTSLTDRQNVRMDKTDYEAKLAAEVEKLKNFQIALEQEHKSIATEANNGEPPLEAKAVYTAAEQLLLKQVPKAADAIVALLEFCDKDATRFSVAKYVIELARDAGVTSKDEHPFEEILRKIGAKPTPLSEQSD